MKLWTIQHAEAWRKFSEVGFLEANEKTYVDSDFHAPYKWMVSQMRAQRGIECNLPIWAWHSYGGKSNPRPDIDDVWLLPEGTKGVLIGCEICESKILLSQFEMWTWVLSGKRILANFREFEQTDFRTEDSVEKTWEHIFDLNFGCEDFWGVFENRAIQACISSLTLDEIVSVDSFVAK